MWLVVRRCSLYPGSWIAIVACEETRVCHAALRFQCVRGSILLIDVRRNRSQGLQRRTRHGSIPRTFPEAVRGRELQAGKCKDAGGRCVGDCNIRHGMHLLVRGARNVHDKTFVLARFGPAIDIRLALDACLIVCSPRDVSPRGIVNSGPDLC